MTATKKRTVASKVNRKSTAKKPTKKTVAKAATQRSFRACADTVPFFTFQVGRQTVYWLILCGFVLALGLWIIHLQVEIEHIYDTIELSALTFK